MYQSSVLTFLASWIGDQAILPGGKHILKLFNFSTPPQLLGNSHPSFWGKTMSIRSAAPLGCGPITVQHSCAKAKDVPPRDPKYSQKSPLQGHIPLLLLLSRPSPLTLSVHQALLGEKKFVHSGRRQHLPIVITVTETVEWSCHQKYMTISFSPWSSAISFAKLGWISPNCGLREKLCLTSCWRKKPHKHLILASVPNVVITNLTLHVSSRGTAHLQVLPAPSLKSSALPWRLLPLSAPLLLPLLPFKQ